MATLAWSGLLQLLPAMYIIFIYNKSASLVLVGSSHKRQKCRQIFIVDADFSFLFFWAIGWFLFIIYIYIYICGAQSKLYAARENEARIFFRVFFYLVAIFFFCMLFVQLCNAFCCCTAALILLLLKVALCVVVDFLTVAPRVCILIILFIFCCV